MSKSNVWDHFKISARNTSIAECQHCDPDSSRKNIKRGSNVKNYSTTPLWNHVKKKHPDVLHKKKESLQVHDESSSSSSCSLEPVKPGTVQLTLQQTIRRKEMWSLDSEKARKITKLICK